MKLLLTIFFSVLLTSCSSSLPLESEVELISTPTPEAWYPDCEEKESGGGISKDGKVSFENVSFEFTSNQISEVEFFASPECVLKSDQIKPDGIGGRTLHFDLQYKDSFEKANISVFKIQDYKNSFAEYPQYVEHRDSDLKKLLADKWNLKTFGPDAPPHVRWMDAGHVFYAKARKIGFVNGNGLLIITIISQDGWAPIENLNLEYFYQGFTNDGKYFVEMDFPVNFRGLPEQEGAFRSTEGKTYEFGSPMPLKIYERYVLQTSQRIDSAVNRDFKPGLDQIEKFIQGFRIEESP